MAPSFYRKGTKVLKSMSPAGSSRFVSIGDGEAVDLVPLENMDEMISIDQHAFWLEGGNSPIFPCIGDDCPGCKLGNDSRFRAFLPVRVKGEKETKILSFGIRLARDLEEVDTELGGVKGKVIRIKRSGSGLKTNYTPIPLGKSVKIDGMETLNMIEHLGPSTAEDIAEALVNSGVIDSPSEVGIKVKKAASPTPSDEAEEDFGEEEVDEIEDDDVVVSSDDDWEDL